MMIKWTIVVHKLPSNITAYLKESKAYIFASLSLLSLLIFTAPAHAEPASTTYHVAPYGNDNNPGTAQAPWQHISFAASNGNIKPGDVVYIRNGTYSEYIKQEISGSPGKPITYKNYPGEKPVITANDSTRSWRWQILDHSYIRIEGLTFNNYQSGAIQVRTIDKDISNVEIVGCVFANQHSTPEENYRAVQITSFTSGHVLSGVVIQSNYFVNMDTGEAPVIQVVGDVYHAKIIGNTLINSTNIGIGIAGRPDMGQAENLLIKGNNISEHGSPGKTTAGIYLDGVGKNILVEENIVHNGLQGIKVDLEPAAASLITSHVIIRRNVLFNNSQINLKMGAGETCVQPGQLKESVAVHNTIFSNINNITNVSFDCGENLRWKNNIFAHFGPENGFQYRLLNENADFTSWVMDHNWFLNNSGEIDHYKWDGKRYDTLAAFQTVSSKDLNSDEGNPGFVASSAYDFRLKADSPARDAGASLTATSSSGSGKVVPVKEAWYFSDGFGLQAGDRIRVGSNPVVTAVSVDYDNNQITVNESITWPANAPVTYDYANNGPDAGAFEFVPALTLNGIPGDKSILLKWAPDDVLPPNVTWKIEYDGPAGDVPSPITSIPGTVREYLLTGLKNYTFYDVTLGAIQDGQPILTSTLHAMPTDIFTYLPLVQK